MSDTTSTPDEGAPTEAAPTKAAPTKAAPTKAAPTKNNAHQGAAHQGGRGDVGACSGHSPQAPFTLAIDIGGTGLKASVLDATGAMVADRVVVATTYPCPPQKMLDDLAALVHPSRRRIGCRQGSPGWSATGSSSRRRTS